MKKHNKEKPYHCDICGKQFTVRGDLVKHLRKHNKEKPYHCDIFGKQIKELSFSKTFFSGLGKIQNKELEQKQIYG